jgi:hypothetical protein
VTGNDAGKGTLVAALAEAAFLIGLERNRLTLLFLLNCRVVSYKLLRFALLVATKFKI